MRISMLFLIGLTAQAAGQDTALFERITATTTEIRLGPVQRDEFTARIIELRPYETDIATGTTVWEGAWGRETVILPRFDGAKDRSYAKFQMVDAATGKPVHAAGYVTHFDLPDQRQTPFPWPESIKGITCPVMRDDIIALGAKSLNTNVVLGQMVDLSGQKRDAVVIVDGEEICINLDYFRRLDDEVKFYSDAGVNVSVVLNNLLPMKPDPSNPFIHPASNLAKAPFHLGAINVTDERGLRYFRAVMEFMAERYSRPDAAHGWISGYIVGNEVTAHWEWYNIGETPVDAFVEQYGLAMRYADLAVRRHCATARVYISLEHHWNRAIRDDGMTAFAGKDFLERLNTWAKTSGDFPWQVAFHPYPENLFEPRFWNDKEAILSTESPKITFKNIEVLPAFLHQPRFDCFGAKRRIILSEQGFNAPEGPGGEEAQAAAYAYAYYKTSHLPGIDAFMLHRHVSTHDEGGLRLGVWDWPEKGSGSPAGKKLQAYEVFRLADTPEWEQAFEFAKPIIGVKDWSEALPSKDIEMGPDLTPAYTLTRDGAPAAVIVVPDDASPAIQYAARQFQELAREMSGQEIPIADSRPEGALAITIEVNPAYPGLAEDGVALRSTPDSIQLTGQNDRAAIYAVYVLFERYLGVRFLAKDCTVIPKRTTITLPTLDYTHTPPFMYRETLYFDSFPMDIALKQRLNGPKNELNADVGGKWEFFPYVHSFCLLVPPEDYFATHPEYFSLISGKRVGEHIHSQLCLSNPEVLAIAKERVLAWIAAHPEVPIIDVSQNDGNGWCECPACQAIVDEEGSQHGPILRFVNAIADEVKAEYPDKWVETLAYAYAVTPPKVTKPRDNVIIRLCHAGCYFHGFEACGMGSNLSANLDAWRALTRRIFIWHYATNFAHYLAPNQNLDGLAKDIRQYAAKGANGLMVQANYQGSSGELSALRQYISSQLMWDPSRNPEMLRLEFCVGYYGGAARDVLEFLELMDKEAARPDVHAFGAWDPRQTTRPEFLQQALVILNRARSRATTADAVNRVGLLLAPFWYMQLAFPDDYSTDPKATSDILLELKTIASATGMTHVNEGALMTDWLAGMSAKYGAAAESIVYDCYLHAWEAERSNCLDWRTASILEAGGAPAEGNTLQQGYAALLPGEREKAAGQGPALLSIFHHPKKKGDADAAFTVAMPALEPGQRLVFTFGTGFSGPSMDGVRFSVLADDEEVFRLEQKDMPVVRHEVDLSTFAGKTIKLTLRVNAIGDEGGDWANWVRPQVVVMK